jgi:hypothetical protein
MLVSEKKGRYMMSEDTQKGYTKIKRLIERSPCEEVVIWIISCEDVYETALGDGKYVYAEKAFLTYKVASSWVNWINAWPETVNGFFGHLATVKPEVLRLGLGGLITCIEPDIEGRFHELPFTSGDLLDDHPSGWEAIVGWLCRYGKIRPDGKNEWEQT